MIPHFLKPNLAASALAIVVCASSGALAQQVPDSFVPQRQSASGTLSCDISAGLGLIVGSSRSMDCTYVPTRGRREQYQGLIRRFGMDLGATAGTRLVWVVLSASDTRRPGRLSGQYVGASADVSLGLGGGANVLVGGSDRTISLQPLSVQAQTGINVAAGVSQLTLTSMR